MSRRPDGRRGRRKPDPAEETASWLLEVERAGEAAEDDEDDWAGTLRATRREATGQFPPVPSDGPGGAQPPSDPMTAPPVGQRQYQQPGSWRGGESSAGEPPPTEPQPWDTQAGNESWAGHWPFEGAGQSWDADDRSYTWPAQELPSSNTGSWEPDPGGSHQSSDRHWADQYGGGHQGSSGYGGTGQGYAGESGYASDQGYGSEQAYGTDGGYGSGSGYAPDQGYGEASGAGAEPGYTADSGYAGYGSDPDGAGSGAGGYASEAGHWTGTSGYSTDPGLGARYDQGGHEQTGAYEQASSYDHTGGYDQSAGYDQGGGYPQAPSYEQRGGRHEAGYRQPSNGYEPGGYPPSGGYDRSDGQTSEGYQQGYEGGYPPSASYGTSGYGGGTAERGDSDPYAGADQYGQNDHYNTGGFRRDDPSASDPGHSAAAVSGHGQPEPPPTPQHDPFAAYGLQNRRSSGDGTQGPRTGPIGAGSNSGPIGAGSSSGPRTGPIGSSSPRTGPIGAGGGAPSGPLSGPIGAAGAAPGVWPAPDSTWPPGSGSSGRPSGTQPRPETWPPQTAAAWQVDQSPSPRPSGEFPRVPDDEEQVVRLGRTVDDQSRGGWGRGRDLGPRLFDEDGEHVSQRARWPRVVAMISWIILLMVLCWFYVFPWLEKILPENF